MSAVLIAAASGRALAASAKRAGFRPLVADWFGDQDTRAAAARVAILPDGLREGMREHTLVPALEDLAAGADPVALVCGSGFEDRPGLVAMLARQWPLRGNGAAVLRRVKDPLSFAALCAKADIPHPPVALTQPADPDRWLVKRIGGAGGTHVMPATAHGGGDGFYFQRRCAGQALSALFLADGRDARVVGFSRQWALPTGGQRFRYGGAVTVDPDPPLAPHIAQAIARLTAASGLVGLNSADLLVDGDAFHLLEVNPRPGATLDIFEPEHGPSLFALHLSACDGTLPDALPPRRGAAASAIVYADRDFGAVTRRDWPDWTADRPWPGVVVKAGDPLCTVIARAADADAARAEAEARAARILAALEPVPS